MKILWVGNIILPQIAAKEGVESPVHNGWIVHLADIISQTENCELTYVFGGKPARKGVVGKICYQALPELGGCERYSSSYVRSVVSLLKQEQPDVIHLWGTESPRTLAFVEGAEEAGMLERVVVSIQGLLSVITKDYTAFLPHRVVHSHTLNSLVKGNIAAAQRHFEKGGKLEEEALSRVKHIIGRTDWDRAATWAINPKATYHLNNETLRESFYSGEWKWEHCEKYSLFCSQSNYPLKGAHLAMRALAIVLRHYPEAKLYVGGHDITRFPFWRISPYRRYLLRLMKELHLEKHVIFTGFLTEQQMKERFLKTHVFISASSIENSPNSVGEAMLLGTPVVASCVGGLLSLMEHGKEGLLYPAHEVNMLAHHICTLFKEREYAESLSAAARQRASRTHDREQNLEVLLQIYRDIMQV